MRRYARWHVGPSRQVSLQEPVENRTSGRGKVYVDGGVYSSIRMATVGYIYRNIAPFGTLG